MLKKILLCTFLLALCQYVAPAQEARLLRFPTISNDAIVFSYAGDLYTVARSGGMARKLTNDIGYEMFARFSPDGKTLAFTGQYDGNTEVYKMPSAGGVPVRLTYSATLGRDDIGDRMGPNNIVMSWKNDNSGIVYRSRKKSFNSFKGQLFIANVEGGLSQELPFSVGGFCTYSPDGKKLALNRVFREFRTWKYYKGGMADDVWIYDFATKQMENITNNPSQDIFPMWYGDKIYFCSDRDRTMNLFSYDLKSKQTTKITNYTEYDVKFPSLGGDAIVYENGGFIYVYDLKAGKESKISITIQDDAVSGRNELIDASKFIEPYDFDLGPDGNRIVVTARGDVWTVPAKEGITRNISKSSASHERSSVWSPDGKSIAFISDVSGEDEVYVQKQDGSEAPTQLTSGSDTYKYYLTWSPDSKKISWADKKLRLQYVEVATKQVTLIDQSKTWEFGGGTWSTDSRWISYSRSEDNRQSRIYLYDTQLKKSYPVTDDWFNSNSPSFSDDGKYLFFSSDRDFAPTYSYTEWNHAYNNLSKIYFVTLAKATPSPLGNKNDEVKVSETPAASPAAKTKEKTPAEEPAKPIKPVVIDVDGLSSRIVSLPIDAGDYGAITAVGESVYYFYSSTKTDQTLKVFDLKDKKESEIGAYTAYVVSADKKKMLLEKDKKFAIVDLPKNKTEVDKHIDLTNLKVAIDRKKEWEQIFNESWRQMRDFFYDPGMHGVDWVAMKKKYQPLLQHVNHRSDLTYVIGEMIAELSIGHAYVGGGDVLKAERIQTGLLGAELSRDASGYFKIDAILKGENWMDSRRSPLTEVGVDVKVGDYIIAVNGTTTQSVKDIYELLVNTANKTIELTVNSKPDKAGSKKVLVVPVNDEQDLYYFNWVKKNLDYVSSKTNGEVGYIHVPDMGTHGLNEFVKTFYPQLHKKALIIDDRGNGGGNVSPQIIERLLREVVFYDLPRNVAVPSTDPGGMLLGPKVMLIDQYSASDGDIFPYRFKKNKIGKVIGKRSWGGVVGIRGSLPFVDGGTLNKPEFASYDTEGKEWPVEGYGVDPDIEVDNSPADEYAGKDMQLDKAIEVILEELKTRKEVPPPPPYPKKNK